MGIKVNRGKVDRSEPRLRLAAVGLEAEFSLFIDNEQVKPERVFGDPRAFVRGSLRHRVGTSYQLPTGAALYFDTGVIEIATPLVELERGCVARAGRSLWESIRFVREELDAWERRTGRAARLVGFSTHYNVSIDIPGSGTGDRGRIDALARLLTYVLPIPVMLLATNRQSTGVGARPRGGRIEVTADFTPSSTLMIATGSLITGIVREMATWPTFSLRILDRKGLPRIVGFRPMPHTSRKGWLARFDCYPANPMTADVNARIWQLWRRGPGHVSLRNIAEDIFRYFRRPIARIADRISLRLIHAVVTGRAKSMLDLQERPGEYEDVGRLCTWQRFYPHEVVERSRFERIVLHALSGDKLRINGAAYTPTGMQGWSRVVFRRDVDGKRIVLPLEDLLEHLQAWDN